MTSWDKFFEEKMKLLLREGAEVVDIGGGLRVLKGRGNRYDKSREWLRPYIEKANYRIMDPVPDYSPDIVGDIHHLPFEDNSLDGIVCMAVLEHVENPILAMQEMHRVLRPEGMLFLYVPFLYYYHAEVGYYRDFWRFTKDALHHMGGIFSRVEIEHVRGPLETLFHLTPLGKRRLILEFARKFDAKYKQGSSQVSGYNGFMVK